MYAKARGYEKVWLISGMVLRMAQVQGRRRNAVVRGKTKTAPGAT